MGNDPDHPEVSFSLAQGIAPKPPKGWESRPNPKISNLFSLLEGIRK
jgi:hypothetical protein